MFIEFVQRYAKKIKLLALFIGIGAVVGVAVPANAYAQTGTVTTARGVLEWIITGGAAIIASWLIDRLRWFDSLDTGLRMVGVTGVAVVLTIVSRIALQYVPAEWFTFADVYLSDVMRYVFPVASMFAAKAVRNGFAKAQTLTKLSASPYSS